MTYQIRERERSIILIRLLQSLPMSILRWGTSKYSTMNFKILLRSRIFFIKTKTWIWDTVFKHVNVSTCTYRDAAHRFSTCVDLLPLLPVYWGYRSYINLLLKNKSNIHFPEKFISEKPSTGAVYACISWCWGIGY